MRRLSYLIPVLLCSALVVGCLKSEDVRPAVVPVGNFSGQFRLISGNTIKKTIDTIKTNIKISLSQEDESFTITGDTSIAHAGSKGHYGINGNIIGFTDNTLSVNNAGKSAPVINGKAHLNGIYLYFYNGNVLQMRTVVGDTIAFEYELKRVN